MARNMTEGDEPTVATRTQADIDAEVQRELPRDLLAGILRLREKASVYLPRWPAEMPYLAEQPDGTTSIVDPWVSRVEGSRLTNKYSEIVRDAAGRIHARPSQPSDGMPATLREWLDDVDGDGRNVDVFGLATATTAFGEGVNFVLCDFPRNPLGAGLSTREDERRLGLAPYWRTYSPSCVFRPRWQGRGSTRRLIEVSLHEHESVSAPGNRWGSGMVEQIRVLRAGVDPAVADASRLDQSDRRRFASFAIYRRGEDGEWSDSPAEVGTMFPQVEIPLVDFPTDIVRRFRSAPAFLDVAWLNLAHFRKTSLLDNAQAAVGFPVLFLSGAPDSAPPSAGGGANRPPGGGGRGVRVRAHSVARMVTTPKEGGDMKFVEPAGSTWAHLQTQLTEMEKAMDAKGLTTMLSEVSGSLTATGEAIRSARGTTWLGAVAGMWEDSYARLLRFTAIYLRLVDPVAVDGWGSLSLNREFVPRARSTEAAGERRYMHEVGVLSDRGLFEEAQRAETIGQDRDFDLERAEVQAQDPRGAGADEDFLARLSAAVGSLASERRPPGEGASGEGRPGDAEGDEEE